MRRFLVIWRWLIAGFVSWSGCQHRPGAELSAILPDQVVRDFRLDESVSGRRLYSLNADSAVFWEEKGIIEVTGPEVVFYDEQGASYSVLVAQSGTVWTKTEDLTARWGVVVKTKDSTILSTDSLSWSNSRRLIYTDAEVVILTPRGRLLGKGLVSDAQLNKIEILSEVQGQGDYEFGP